MITLIAATRRQLLSTIRGYKPTRISRDFSWSLYAATLPFLIQMQTKAADKQREKRPRRRRGNKKEQITYHPRLEDDVQYFIKAYGSNFHGNLIRDQALVYGELWDFGPVGSPRAYAGKGKPINDRRIHLFQSYALLRPEIRTVMTLILMWNCSHGFEIDQINHIAIAIMLIAWMQSKGRLPNLQDLQDLRSPDPGDSGTALNRAPIQTYQEGGKIKSDAKAIDTTFKQPAEGAPHVPPGSLFVDFLCFLGDLRSNTVMFSVRNGGVINRVYADPPTPPDAKKPDIILDGADWVSPDAWSRDALVVQDPFLPNENLTPSITMVRWNEYQALAKKSGRFLQTRPLWLAFGPNFTFPQPTPDPKIDDHVEGFYVVSRPPSHILAARNAVIALVQNAIIRSFGASYKVELFGSTVYGVDSPSTDLDLVVVDKYHKNGWAPHVLLDKLPAIYNMRRIASVLSREGFQGIFAIPRASTPIVKAYYPTYNINIDINANEQLGLFNTRLIDSYCRMYPMLRPLIFFIKFWAKSHGLNNPSAVNGPRTMSSYCYTLMIISWLQMINVLPNLQADLPPANEAQGFWIRSRETRIWCDNRFKQAPPPHWRPKTFKIGYLLLGWFDYWGTRHNYTTTGMSIREGGSIKRKMPVPTIGVPFHPTNFSENQPVASAQYDGLYSHLVPPERGGALETSGSSRIKTAQSSQSARLEVEMDQVEPDPQCLKQDMFEHNGFDEITPLIRGLDLLAQSKNMADETQDARRDTDMSEDVREDIEEDPDEGMAEDLVHDVDEEPRSWRNSLLLVPDPFIFAKNAAGAINPQAVMRFRAECVRSVQVIVGGRPIQETLGSSKAIDEFKNQVLPQVAQLSFTHGPSVHHRTTDEEKKKEKNLRFV